MSDRQLRDAMHRQTDGVDPTAPPWSSIEDRAAAIPARRRFTPTMITLAAVAALVMVVAAAVVLRPDNKPARQVTTLPGETTTTVPETTTTTVSETRVVDPASVHSVYPFATKADLDAYRASGNNGFSDPRQVAWSFAHKFLAMPTAVTSPFQAKPGTPSTSGTVDIRPDPNSTQITSVELTQVSADAWTVTGAHTNDILVSDPSGGTTTSSPVHVAGESTAFEATIRVEVWTAGEHFASLGAKPVMGGSNGQKGPFSDEVPFAAPSSSTPGAVVLSIISAKDGNLVAATVVALTLSP